MRDRSTAFWLALQLSLAVALADSTQNTTTTGSNNLETRVGWYAGPTERGTLTLVYSCLATIITCTWTVLHLNVPALEDESWRRGFRKAKWMAITILFPEFIFAKAICELRSALHGLLEFDTTLREWEGDLSHKIPGKNDGDPDIVWTWETKFPRGCVAGLLYPLFGLPRPRRRGTTDATTAEHDRENTTTINVSGAGGDKSNEPTPTRNHTNDKHDQVKTLKTTIQKWSLTHSYLANMGGLVYIQSTRYQEKASLEILTGIELGRCYFWEGKQHPLQNLVLSEDEINDKSKADWLLKTLSVLQISWLILTVLARFALELPLTQLEIVTLAFSVFAIATFIANWWKPKDISTPIRIPCSANAWRYSEFNLQFSDPAPYGINGTPSFVSWLVSPAGTRKRSKRTKQDRSRVENDMVETQGRIPLLIQLMAGAGFIFGGLHCLAWSFVFPSRAELLLWRVASIGSAIVPFISLVASIWLNRLVTSSLDKWLMDKLQFFTNYSPEYIDLLLKPDFLVKWNLDEQQAFFARSTAGRNFQFRLQSESKTNHEKTDST